MNLKDFTWFRIGIKSKLVMDMKGMRFESMGSQGTKIMQLKITLLAREPSA